jgi:hypothetical protein
MIAEQKDNKTISNLINASFKTLGILFVFIAFGLYFDSSFFISLDKKGQVYANIAMLIVYFILLFKATNRARELMIYATLIGVAGEYLFSLGFEMYTYRLENVPLYVPPGHAIIYIVTFYFCRQAAVKHFQKSIERGLVIFMLIYASLFLIFAQDIFGFSLTVLILYILRNKPREKLFYCSMYLVVAVLEIIGTCYQCWSWPDTAFGIIPFLKSANPPSGISFFYFGLDLGSLWLYKQRHKIAWKRMKTIRFKKAYNTSTLN